MSSYALFEVAPYVAAASLLLATPLRYVRARARGRLTAREGGLALRLFARNGLWRLGLAGVLLSHSLMLLLPGWILAWNREAPRLLVLEGLFCGAGLVALLGLAGLLRRYTVDTALRAYSSLADVALLALLAVQLLSGLSTTLLYRWASTWSAVTLTPYVRSVAGLSPRLPLIEAMPYLVKLHIFSTFAALTVVPFTHAADLLLVPFDQALDRALAPLSRLARAGRERLLPRGQQLLAVLGWREEEDEVG